MKRTQDRAVQYQLEMDEEGILLAAATILEQRLQRQGRIHSPDQAGDYLVARCAHLPHEVFGGRLPRHQASHPRNRTSLQRHHRRVRCPPASRSKACPGPQRRRRHPLPQPPERESRAQRSRPQSHRAPEAGAGAARHPRPRPPGHRRSAAHQPGRKGVGIAPPLAYGLGRHSGRVKLFLSAETTAHGRDKTHVINNAQSADGRELLHV